MHSVKLTPGDFLKNAGNVGFLRLWEFICRDRGEEFKIVDEVPVEALPNEKELAQYIMNLYISEYAAESKVQKAFDKLDLFVERIESGRSLDGDSDDSNYVDVDRIKDDVKLIVDALTAASIKSGFEGVKEQVKFCEVYEDFLKNKLPLPKSQADQQTVLAVLKARIKSLQTFCKQPLVRQAFLFKSVAYNVINRFWSDKCFLLRANAKKNMATLIEDDFTKAFIQYVSKGRDAKLPKVAVNCISCSGTISKMSDGVPISFMIDVVDDLARKTSTFWNHNPDAYLCPVCALIYSLAPLGFRQIDNGDFVFINSNASLETLWANNAKKIDVPRTSKVLPGFNEEVGDIEKEPDTVLRRVDAALLKLLDDKSKILSNVQTIIRTKQENGDGFTYQFNIFDRDLLYLIHKERLPNSIVPFPSIRSSLKQLAKHGYFKTKSGDYFNVYRHCLDNILAYRNQYNLLNMLILESLKKEDEKTKRENRKMLNFALVSVFRIQCLQTYHMSKGEENDPMKNISTWQFQASKEGASMRDMLLADAVGRENVAGLAPDRHYYIVCSVVYRLANALKTRNVEQFVDILIRLYSSCKESIPTVFMTALRNEDAFPLVGYAYLLGLKGAFYQSKKSDEAETSN